MIILTFNHRLKNPFLHTVTKRSVYTKAVLGTLDNNTPNTNTNIPQIKPNNTVENSNTMDESLKKAQEAYNELVHKRREQTRQILNEMDSMEASNLTTRTKTKITEETMKESAPKVMYVPQIETTSNTTTVSSTPSTIITTVVSPKNEEKSKETEPNDEASSSSSSPISSQPIIITENLEANNENTDSNNDVLDEEDRRLLERTEHIVRVGTEMLHENLNRNNITLQRTAEQTERWLNLKKRLAEYIKKSKGVLPRWTGYLAAGVSVGSMIFFITRYHQLPIFSLIQGTLGNIGTAATRTTDPISVNITLPPMTMPTQLPPLPQLPTNIFEQFPAASGMGFGLITGLLFVLKFLKK